MISTYIIQVVAEWLRRLTRNQISSEAEVRVLSTTLFSINFFGFFLEAAEYQISTFTAELYVGSLFQRFAPQRLRRSKNR